MLGICNGRKISGLKFMENALNLPYFAFVKRKIFALGKQRNFLANFFKVLGCAYQQTCENCIDFTQFQRCCVLENGRLSAMQIYCAVKSII